MGKQIDSKNPTPSRRIRSTFEVLEELAGAARASSGKLLDMTTLTAWDEGAPVVRTRQYFNWGLPKNSRKTRYRTERDLETFGDVLNRILTHHDMSAVGALEHYQDRAYEVIRQQGQTQIGSIGEAREAVETFIAKGLEFVSDLYDPLEGELVLLPDTNVIIDRPDFEGYDFRFGPFRLVLLPIVLSELDALKRRTRERPEVSEKARQAIRFIKQHGDLGNLLEGVELNEGVILMTSPIEPTLETLPVWLQGEVPDDRLVATALTFARDHPHTRVGVVSGDLNVMNKARAAGLSTVDPEPLHVGSGP